MPKVAGSSGIHTHVCLMSRPALQSLLVGWGDSHQERLIPNEALREGTENEDPPPTFPNGASSEEWDSWGSPVGLPSGGQVLPSGGQEKHRTKGSQMRGDHKKLGSWGNRHPT